VVAAVVLGFWFATPAFPEAARTAHPVAVQWLWTAASIKFHSTYGLTIIIIDY
jgi:hypothetical protein